MTTKITYKPTPDPDNWIIKMWLDKAKGEMTKCNHSLGHKWDYDSVEILFQNDLPVEILRLKQETRDCEIKYPFLYKYRILWSDRDHLEASWVLYKHCPECGNKIEWEVLV